jgi:RNA-binding proteins (RRM domain)
MNIFVAKLNYSTTEEDLRALFEQYGTVSSTKIIFDRYENRSKGFGFVEMDDDNEALNAIENLNETELAGRTIVVKKARPKSDNGGFHNRGRRN